MSLGFIDIEKKLLFYPINKNISNIWIDLEKELEDTYFYSNDGIKLNGWYVMANENMPTIIYCHGQGENISLWQNVLKRLTDEGYGVFMIEYRGHGRSEGKPFEQGLYRDLESAVSYLNNYKNISNNNIILWGRSLGGAVATDVASRNSFKALILESTFTNLRDEAINMCETGVLEGRNGFWGKISSNFIKCYPFTQKFATDTKISRVKYPLLIGHSVYDDTVPCYMSKDLAKINPNAELFISETGSHHSSEWFLDEAISFLNNLAKS